MFIMKKNNILILLILIFMLFFFCRGNNLNKIFKYDFKIAVIQTSSTKFKSYLSLFDKDLNFISRVKINYGGLSHCWDFPKSIENKIFINIKGTDFLLKSKILELDFEKKKYKIHDVGQKFSTCFCVDKKNIYAANCTGSANIVKHNLKKNINQKLIIPESYITHMKIYDGKLFAFGNFFHNQIKNFIYIIDADNLKIIKKIDIKKFGAGQYDLLKIGDNIFFGGLSQIKKTGKNFIESENNILCKLNLRDNQIKKIYLNEISPKQILLYKNKLIISHDDWHQNKKNLSVYNLHTNEKKLIKIKNFPYQIWLDKNKIYSVDQKKICKYNADNFLLEKEINLETKKNLGDNFFISGFFIRK